MRDHPGGDDATIPGGMIGRTAWFLRELGRSAFHGLRADGRHRPRPATMIRPQPFRAEYRSRFRQWLGSVIVLFAGAILLMVANLPGLSGFLFFALVLMLIVGSLWVAGPGRQYDRIRLERELRDEPAPPPAR